MRFAEQSIESFLVSVASHALTPSAGAVAAVVGASGAALCEMVCLHTVGNDGSDDVETELADDVETELVDVGETLRAFRGRLLALADEDAAAVEGVRSVFETQTEEGERAGQSKRQDAIRRAIEVPLEIAETCLAILERAAVVAVKGTQKARADAVTGAFLAHAALQASLGLVRTNLALLDTGPFVSETSERVAELEDSGQEALEGVQSALEKKT